MNKIIEFIKKYKLYILIGITVGLIIGAIIIFFQNKNKVDISQIKTIESPFVKQEDGIDISVSNYDLESEFETIYKTGEASTKMARDFVDKFYDSSENLEYSDYAMIWVYDDDIFSYILNTGLFFFNSTDGLKIGLNSLNTERVEDFLETMYEGIDIVGINEEIEDDLYKFTGYYSLENENFGSLYLEGYAFEMYFDQNAKLYKMSILLIDLVDISMYQQMPISNITDLTSIDNYPIYTKVLEYDENYQNQYDLIKASTKLKSFSGGKPVLQKIFIDYEYGYIVPMYKTTGDGELEDSQGDDYWAQVNLYICAISPDYLTEKQEEEMILTDSQE